MYRLTHNQRRAAIGEAQAMLSEFNVDDTEPVDVFDLIDQLDLWLTFVPLEGTLGVCLPEGVGGIMITSRRQPAVQRYTAAHEVGHWILHRGSAWADDSDAIYDPAAPERERVAQLFAAYLLMPPALVLRVSGHYGVSPRSTVLPRDAYLVARDMGSSYEAAVRQMTNVGAISRSQRDELLRAQPLDAKRALANGIRPIDGNADVWPVDEQWDRSHLDVSVGDEIVVALPENRSTGYKWMTDDDVLRRDSRVGRVGAGPPEGTDSSEERRPVPSRSLVEPDQRDASTSDVPLERVSDLLAMTDVPSGVLLRRRQRRDVARREVSEDVRVGGTGRRWMSMRANREGTWRLELSYRAAFEPDTPPVATFAVDATVHPKPAERNARELIRTIDWHDQSSDPSIPFN